MDLRLRGRVLVRGNGHTTGWKLAVDGERPGEGGGRQGQRQRRNQKNGGSGEYAAAAMSTLTARDQ